MIYEYRAYYVMPGRMPDIQRRFAEITLNLFKKHGIRVVGFWETVIGESNELVYICVYWSGEKAGGLPILVATPSPGAKGPPGGPGVDKDFRPAPLSPPPEI